MAEPTPEKSSLHSVVVPVYNSRPTLPLLVGEVRAALDGAKLNWELVLVDDGSRDGSFEEIKRLAREEPRVRGLRLSRNFGHQPALTVGLRESRGEYVAIIDDDLQDPPGILPEFFARLYSGLDVVYGLRRKRKEGLFKRALYAGFYRILRFLSEIEIPLDTGDFCAMRRNVKEAMLELREAHPFLRGTRSWAGFRQEGVEYERSARAGGESGYTMGKYLSLALNGIMATSRKPLKLATGIGFTTAFISFLVGIYQFVAKLAGAYNVPGYASLVTIMVFMGGIQLFFLGVIGHYLARMFEEVRRWPVAFVAEKTAERDE